MTISVDNRTESYPGAGASGPFTFDFPVGATNEIVVTKYDASNSPTVLSLAASAPGDTQYTNTLTSGGAAGGSVNLGLDLEIGETLNIQGVTPVSQGIPFVNQGAFFAEKHETAFDKLTRIIQEVNRDTGRALQLSPLDDDGSVSQVLPPLSASTALAVNSAGTGLELVSFGSLVGSIDTVFTSLASGDFLQYGGANWENKTTAQVKTALSLGALADLGTVDTAQIDDDAITTPKLLDAAVTEQKIADTTITAIRSIPQNSQSAAYELVLGDGGKHILHPSADTSARIWTIPAHASVAFPIGTAITFVNQNGGGDITIAITSDTMRLAKNGTTGNRTLAENGVATALKITNTEWIISGVALT